MAIERLTPEDSNEWRSLGIQHLQRYELASRFAQGRTVLDLACGNGYGAYTLINLGARSVAAVDLDNAAIDYARRHYSKRNLEYICQDCFKFKPPPSGFEVIVSFETIEHLKEPKNFIRKLRDLILNQGRLLISAPNTLRYKRAARPITNPYHFSEPTYEDFREWVETCFVIDQEWEQSPVTVGFDRQSALVQRSGFVRWGLRLECLLKRITRRPSLAGTETWLREQESQPILFTQIFPLLPERRQCADVFLFVCSPR
jgi:SAM-dependent methyltransferase